jgi:hypothetical protein
MVVFYGTPLAEGLGILGVFEPEEAAARVREQASVFDDINGERGVLPAFDLIYSMAMDIPTPNGLYLRYLGDWLVERYLAVAEEHDLQLILDLQIGRGDILQEVHKIERFLLHPRVHVAIDPEYAVGPDGVPVATPGRISGHDINAVQAYIGDLVAREALPPKLVVLHQYIDETVTDGEATIDVPNVDLVLNMDGWGDEQEKRDKYWAYAGLPYAERRSFNIFLRQDHRVLSEAEALQLAPSPDVIFYQ